jgi:hypothetical protein
MEKSIVVKQSFWIIFKNFNIFLQTFIFYNSPLITTRNLKTIKTPTNLINTLIPLTTIITMKSVITIITMIIITTIKTTTNIINNSNYCFINSLQESWNWSQPVLFNPSLLKTIYLIFILVVTWVLSDIHDELKF